MNEQETTNTTPNPEPEPTEPTSVPTAEENKPETTEGAPDGVRKKYFMIAAVLVVLAIFLAIFYSMEKNGQTNTGVFDGVERWMGDRSTVATVNGATISGTDLRISIEQITAGAELQGIDVTDPQVQSDIRDQAVEVLVNTELLMQEAENRGITVTDEEVEARYNALVEEVGGEESLEERMDTFGIDNKTLLRDIRNELTIQQLLDQVFASEDLTVTSEEVSTAYNAAGGEEAGLPALAELQAQIEQQLRSVKEQEVVTTLIDLLRSGATIEVE